MLTIRKEQISAFENSALHEFEDAMVDYLKRYFPKNYKIHGNIRIHEIVRYGIEQAEIHEFTSKGGATKYISLMLMLGHNFYEDPQLSLLSEMFKDKNLKPNTKIDRIYNEALVYLNQVSGVKDENLLKALHRIQKKSNSEIFRPSGVDFEQDIISHLNNIFPEKCEVIGAVNLHHLILKGKKAAGEYSITDEQGIFIYITCMFMLGCGFDSDPQCPWAMEILNQSPSIEQDCKAYRLYMTALSVLEQWLV